MEKIKQDTPSLESITTGQKNFVQGLLLITGSRNLDEARGKRSEYQLLKVPDERQDGGKDALEEQISKKIDDQGERCQICH